MFYSPLFQPRCSPPKNHVRRCIFHVGNAGRTLSTVLKHFPIRRTPPSVATVVKRCRVARYWLWHHVLYVTLHLTHWPAMTCLSTPLINQIRFGCTGCPTQLRSNFRAICTAHLKTPFHAPVITTTPLDGLRLLYHLRPDLHPHLRLTSRHIPRLLVPKT